MCLVRPDIFCRPQIPGHQHDAHLNKEQDGIKMQEMNRDHVEKHKLGQTVSDDMEYYYYLGSKWRDSFGKQSHQNNGNDRYVIEAGEKCG